mmetsp:Transcript_6060/g.12304  ORF Transcript_6060/g.12304 Transcript_6060/m.12304 type:complete len:249 (-) Transcript_6060:55-801(-)
MMATSLDNMTKFSSISNCLRRIRRALKNWFSSGLHFAPGRRSSRVLIPLLSTWSACTIISPVAGLVTTIRTTSTIRTRSFRTGSICKVASPRISSAEKALMVLKPGWPNLATSTPLDIKCSRNGSSAMPIGARTKVETASPTSPLSLTFLDSATSSVIHSMNLVFPALSEALHVPYEGSPTFCNKAVSEAANTPSRISLRYTVRTPGYEGDSISSSCRSVCFKSNFAASFGMLSMSARMRSATCRVFS